MKQLRNHIGGEWLDGADGQTREILDPATGAVIAGAVESRRDDAEAAISVAREAFDRGPWPRTPPAERAALLARMADLIDEDAAALAAAETRDTGKTLAESGWDVADVAGVFRYYAGLAGHLDDEVLAAPNADATSRLVKHPIGVCAQICPWNYPLLQASWKVAPALLAGCTIILKPSELTPLTTVTLVEIAAEAGLPPGVLNLVLGAGEPAGAALAESAAVDLVSFTGGAETGRRVMRAGASNIKKVTLELGGKNPHLVFDDADLNVAVDMALNGAFFHAGQICSAGARLMLQDGIHDAFVARLTERVRSIRVGPGTADGTQMGPLISLEHREKVHAHVTRAVQQGAILACGGRPSRDPALARGFFYEPTLLTGCRPGMDIVREEVFGPVLTVERFATEAEAIARANDTDDGLSAGFWTRDEARIERIARALRFGTVWVNDYNVYFPEAPWGGFKRSGLGRELGVVGLDEYLEVQHVYRNRSPAALGWF